MTYIANWRIMKAYNLIKYGSTPLEQIAESVGFGSARTLNKSFQRYYDCTPNELRRQLQSADSAG
jgi:transcriptional regulator GlxA family with amidase domain